MKEEIFISSVQKEFAEERRALKDYIDGDPLLNRFFHVFLFENVPALDRRPDEVYLEQVDHCAIYVGLLGDQYGQEDAEGFSPTEREFDRATAKGKIRLIFVKGAGDAKRHLKMQALLRKAGDQLIRRRFTDAPELTADIYASLIDYLENTGALRSGPFDAAACPQATLDDMADDKVRRFLRAARRERQYVLEEDTPLADVLTHLNLMDRGRPNHAAILLFGKEPQRFLPTSEIKCLNFHGMEVRKPIPSYQIFKGTVFDLVDEAVDFVLSKIARSVGTREQGPQAPVTYELPKDAVLEAIVNAVAHRDYASNASVQVMLFADRLEVWNPGRLPPSLTPEKLRHPHASIPHNPLIADPLFLVRYVEKAGSGTLDMIALCREVGLPEPDFRQDDGQFVMTIWRDWLTEKVLATLELNERQKKAITHTRTSGQVTNSEYQQLYGVAKPTASRDLEDLFKKKIFQKVGTTGKGTYYTLYHKGLTKGSKGSLKASAGKGSVTAQRAHASIPKRGIKRSKSLLARSKKPRFRRKPKGRN